MIAKAHGLGTVYDSFAKWARKSIEVQFGEGFLKNPRNSGVFGAVITDNDENNATQDAFLALVVLRCLAQKELAFSGILSQNFSARSLWPGFSLPVFRMKRIAIEWLSEAPRKFYRGFVRVTESD